MKTIEWDGHSKFARIKFNKTESEKCFLKNETRYRVEGEKTLRLGFSREINPNDENNWPLIELAEDFADEHQVYVHLQNADDITMDIIHPTTATV